MRTQSTGILIFLLVLSNIGSAWADPALELAEALSQQGAVDAAITEYKRYLFFHPAAPDSPAICRQIGLAYRAQSEWDPAVVWLRRALKESADERERTAIRADLAEALLASGNPNLALFELLKAETSTSDKVAERRVSLLQAMTYLHLYRWQEAAEAFERYFGGTQNPNAVQILETLRHAVEHRGRSPTVARWLSTFIPGAGQIYAGDWRGGLNAFVLNGVLLYVTTSALRDHQFDDAVFSGSMIFQRYYSGNRYRAAEAAKRANERFNQEMREVILQKRVTQFVELAELMHRVWGDQLLGLQQALTPADSPTR